MKDPRYEAGEVIPGTGYHFVRSLGEGGQGVVYQVHEPVLFKHFAMKLLNPEMASEEKYVLALRNEARLLAQQDSPHLVSVLSAGVTAEAQPRPYFVMELLKGMSLSDVLRSIPQGRLPIREAIHLAIQVLRGLDAAHTHESFSIVHRDIKPSNIWVHKVPPMDSRAVILDLGIARMMDASLRTSDTSNFFKGTFDYAAPEQYEGLAMAQTDLYAVAGLVFRMIVGRRVFEGDKAQDFIRQHVGLKAPRMSDFTGVPAKLDALVAMALEKDPQKRPRSAHQMASMLQQVLDDERERESKLPQRHDTIETPMDYLFNEAADRQKEVEAQLTAALQAKLTPPQPVVARASRPPAPNPVPNPAPNPEHKGAGRVIRGLEAEPSMVIDLGPELAPTVPAGVAYGRQKPQVARDAVTRTAERQVNVTGIARAGTEAVPIEELESMIVADAVRREQTRRHSGRHSGSTMPLGYEAGPWVPADQVFRNARPNETMQTAELPLNRLGPERRASAALLTSVPEEYRRREEMVIPEARPEDWLPGYGPPQKKRSVPWQSRPATWAIVSAAVLVVIVFGALLVHFMQRSGKQGPAPTMEQGKGNPQ
jgi:serine/threonine protein kinase